MIWTRWSIGALVGMALALIHGPLWFFVGPVSVALLSLHSEVRRA